LKYGHRLVIDTILYVPVSGFAWRLVPHDRAPWDAAYRWFRLWSAQGVWDDIHDALGDHVRRAEGRDPAPSAAVLDAQTAQSACGDEAVGYDANVVDASLIGWATTNWVYASRSSNAATM
jgi:transposase